MMFTSEQSHSCTPMTGIYLDFLPQFPFSLVHLTTFFSNSKNYETISIFNYQTQSIGSVTRTLNESNAEVQEENENTSNINSFVISLIFFEVKKY
jgi:uncharacterized membrane protein YbaN (DUF454 family)